MSPERLAIFLLYGGQLSGCDFPDGDEGNRVGGVGGDVFFEPDHVVPFAAFVAGIAVQARAGKSERFVQSFASGVRQGHDAEHRPDILEDEHVDQGPVECGAPSFRTAGGIQID